MEIKLLNYLNKMEDIGFNIIKYSDIDDIHNICQTSNIGYKICQNRHFWEQKFKQDKLKLISYKKTINEWIKEYKKIKKCIDEANNIITISLIEKNMKIKSLYDNDGTIMILNRTDDPIQYQNYHIWYFPNQLISLISEKYNNENITPMIINFVPKDNYYTLICELYNKDDIEIFDDEYIVSIDVSLYDMKDIIVGALYDGIQLICDIDENLYIPIDNLPIIHEQNFENTIKFSRIAMLNTLQYINI